MLITFLSSHYFFDSQKWWTIRHTHKKKTLILLEAYMYINLQVDYLWWIFSLLSFAFHLQTCVLPTIVWWACGCWHLTLDFGPKTWKAIVTLKYLLVPGIRLESKLYRIWMNGVIRSIWYSYYFRHSLPISNPSVGRGLWAWHLHKTITSALLVLAADHIWWS